MVIVSWCVMKYEMFDVLNKLGEFTGKIASRDECHNNGYWHRAVYAFIIDKNSNVLLQKRSKNKKLWPILILKQVNIDTLELQDDEVGAVRYCSSDELVKRINNNYDGLTEKNVSWGILKKILEPDGFSCIIKYIIGQISDKARETIWNKFKMKYNNINPKDILNVAN